MFFRILRNVCSVLLFCWLTKITGALSLLDGWPWERGYSKVNLSVQRLHGTQGALSDIPSKRDQKGANIHLHRMSIVAIKPREGRKALIRSIVYCDAIPQREMQLQGRQLQDMGLDF